MMQALPKETLKNNNRIVTSSYCSGRQLCCQFFDTGVPVSWDLWVQTERLNMLIHVLYKPDLTVSKENIQRMVAKRYRHILYLHNYQMCFSFTITINFPQVPFSKSDDSWWLQENITKIRAKQNNTHQLKCYRTVHSTENEIMVWSTGEGAWIYS